MAPDAWIGFAGLWKKRISRKVESVKEKLD